MGKAEEKKGGQEMSLLSGSIGEIDFVLELLGMR